MFIGIKVNKTIDDFENTTERTGLATLQSINKALMSFSLQYIKIHLERAHGVAFKGYPKDE